jgi:cupin fold WbuC family metalloprotein
LLQLLLRLNFLCYIPQVGNIKRRERELKKTRCITGKELDNLTVIARESARRRKNYNFHYSDTDPSHSLLNAMEPDSYIQPHRHQDPNKDETLLVIRGKIGMIIFDDNGRIQGKAVLAAGGDPAVVNIPSGVFHTWVSLEPGTIFFETKAGPFIPLSGEEKAPWAPEENANNSQDYLESLRELFKV